MRSLLTIMLSCLASGFIFLLYWLGGGDFQRSPELQLFTFLAGLGFLGTVFIVAAGFDAMGF